MLHARWIHTHSQGGRSGGMQGNGKFDSEKLKIKG